MKRLFFFLLLFAAIALISWGISTPDKEGIGVFFLGATLLLSTLAVGGLRLAGSTRSNRRTTSTNLTAILGAVIGLFLGGVAGAKSGFGRVMISIFNPDLPEQDFGIPLGAIGGGILGAFFLALFSGILKKLFVQPETGQTAANSREHDSNQDTA